MNRHFLKCNLRALIGAGCIAVSIIATTPAFSQQVPLRPRITAQVDNSERVSVKGSISPKARASNDVGAVAPGMQLRGVTLNFSRTAAQQVALDQLVAAQQNPASAFYHQWITPEQYAAQFGVAEVDIASIQAWLEQQGFAVESVSRSRNSISFSGSAAQVESAFGTQIHNYRGQGEPSSHFSPSTDLTIPAAIAPVVQSIANLSSFRLHSRARVQQPSLHPQFTVTGTQYYFLTPTDVATIYNVQAEYSQGYSGSGQTIAIVGQSAVVATDIANFRKALGLSVNAPSLNLVPGTGTSLVVTDDETESDLDLEYSGAMAPAAKIAFYYAGNNQNYGVMDAMQYVIDNNSAPIISISYGDCEFDTGSANLATLDSIFEQGTSQGQTIIASSGDDGSQDCAEDTNLTKLQQQALAVDYPASSPYVTGLGGTEFPAADVTPTNTTYWTSDSSNADLVSSAKSYIPEQIWNDDVASKTWSGGGGGISLYEARPVWQSGVTGIASGTYRMVPDISLASSPDYPGYLYCSSDSTSTGVTNGCSSGFRNSTASSFQYEVAGGTSFAAPIFAGLLAVINQAKGYTDGQGLINPTLYSLAGNSATYASAFHDITSGGNNCLLTAANCGTGAQTSDYMAGTGYDEASGLGSVNFSNLVAAWPKYETALSATATTLTATPTNVLSGASVALTATVKSGTTVAASGTVTFLAGSTIVGTGTVSITGTASLSLATLPVGVNSLTADYGGTTTLAASASTAVTVTVAAPTTAATTTTLTATPTKSSSGATVTLTATITSGTTAVTSGVVTFMEGGTSIGTGTFNILKTATLSLTTLPTGSDSITASYGGTTSLSSSISAPVIVTVATSSAVITVPTPSPVSAGAGATTTVTLSAGTNYIGSMNITCALSSSPGGAQNLPTCSLKPTLLEVEANGAALSTLVVQTSGTTSTAQSRPSGLNPWGLGGGSVIAGLMIFFPSRRRRMLSMLALLLVIASVGSIGCGGAAAGGSTTTVASTATTAGSYTYTITGTDTINPTIMTSTTVVITVQ
jgi:subtilase family serine protease